LALYRRTEAKVFVPLARNKSRGTETFDSVIKSIGLFIGELRQRSLYLLPEKLAG
jgi:hypothetical protein